MNLLSERLVEVQVGAIYTSPLERAVETAEILAAPHHLTVRVREDLGEMHFGEWDGMTFDQLSETSSWSSFNTVRSMIRPPAGEMMVEVQSRMIGAVEELHGQHDGGTIVIVSHADPIKAVVAHCVGCSLDMLSRFMIDPASLTALRFVNNVPTLLCVNCADASAL